MPIANAANASANSQCQYVAKKPKAKSLAKTVKDLAFFGCRNQKIRGQWKPMKSRGNPEIPWNRWKTLDGPWVPPKQNPLNLKM